MNEKTEKLKISGEHYRILKTVGLWMALIVMPTLAYSGTPIVCEVVSKLKSADRDLKFQESLLLDITEEQGHFFVKGRSRTMLFVGGTSLQLPSTISMHDMSTPNEYHVLSTSVQPNLAGSMEKSVSKFRLNRVSGSLFYEYSIDSVLNFSVAGSCAKTARKF